MYDFLLFSEGLPTKRGEKHFFDSKTFQKRKSVSLFWFSCSETLMIAATFVLVSSQ